MRAYDLIAPTLTPAERETIVSGVFDFVVDLNARWEPSYHNTDPYVFEALARFGLVLNRPEWVHRAVRHADELLAIGFSPDGLWCEATPAYHRQVTGYYGVLARLLDGYSDPEGFRDPISGARFDRLDLTRRWAPAVARMQQGLDKLTLPDGFLAAINDSDPDRYPGSFAGGGGGDLLGTSGFAILAGDEGRDRVILNFGGTYGHEHGDVNGLLWYALGERRFDETRYRPLPGSGSTRKWSSSTTAHNTVVIDESNQANRFVHQRSFGPDDAMAGRTAWLGRETNGGTDHTGDLLLFDGEGDVQVVEVEGKKAYQPVAERYRRTLVKVDLGGGGGYLVDLFRVKGGRVHDYLLHGPLHRAYTAHFSLPLEERPDPGPAKESPARPFDYLRVIGEARTGAAPWHLTFSTPDGRHTRSWFLGPRDALVRSCLAPAINRPGDAPFVAFRHEAGESLYVVVHEAYADRPRVLEAKLLGTGADGEAAVMVRLDGRTDVILSTPEPDGSITARWAEGAAASLTGRLGFLQLSGKEARKALLWDGTDLSHGPVKLKARFPALEGVVRRTLRKEAGDPVDALELAFRKGEGVPPSGAAIHVRFGGGDGTGRVWSYRLTGLPDERQAGFRVGHDPGFEIRENGVAKMLFHPGWGVPGGATFRIPLRATWIAPAPSSTTSAL